MLSSSTKRHGEMAELLKRKADVNALDAIGMVDLGLFNNELQVAG